MTKTLFELTYRTNIALGNVHEGVCSTDGTTTTIVDSKLTNFGYPDDFFNDGTAYIVRDISGDTVRSRQVSDYVASTGTITTGAFSVASATNDQYAVSTKKYPYRIIGQKIRDVLWEFDLLTTDTSTITIVADQSEYNLPVALMDLREVYIQGRTDDSDDNLWTILRNWRVEKTTTGTVDKLVFDEGLPTGYKLKLVYAAPPPDLWSDADQLDEGIPHQLVIARAVVGCLLWALAQPVINKDPSLADQLAAAQARVDRYERRYHQKLPRRQGRILKPWEYTGQTGRYGEYIE